MSERLPDPDPSRFPSLDEDASWVRTFPAETAFSRIYRAGGSYPSNWYEFRDFGPLDARFDPHPEPIGRHPGYEVMYAVPQLTAPGSPTGAAADDPEYSSAFATCLLEVFQQFLIVDRRAGSPTFAVFETTRRLRLLDLSDSDWVTVAGGNAAIAAGEHERSRRWARAIREGYPDIDGVIAASSVVPNARVAALWSPAQSAIPRHPLALISLDRDELSDLIDRIVERYGYILL